MPRSMADPDYVYRPLSAAQRKKISDAHRAIRGIPKGYRRLYDVNVPERQYDEIKPLVAYVLRHSADDMEVVRTLIRVLVRVRPLIQPGERKRLHRALAILAIKDLSALERAERRSRQR